MTLNVSEHFVFAASLPLMVSVVSLFASIESSGVIIIVNSLVPLPSSYGKTPLSAPDISAQESLGPSTSILIFQSELPVLEKVAITDTLSSGFAKAVVLSRVKSQE